MKKFWNKLRKTRRGQGMTEYIIIVALIAIAAIAVITLFGNNLRGLFGASANALAGSVNVTSNGSNANQSVQKKNLSNFGTAMDTF
jgi:pilus assembly protein Flp/PilA